LALVLRLQGCLQSLPPAVRGLAAVAGLLPWLQLLPPFEQHAAWQWPAAHSTEHQLALKPPRNNLPVAFAHAAHADTVRHSMYLNMPLWEY
jgi:hypothetical protein